MDKIRVVLIALLLMISFALIIQYGQYNNEKEKSKLLNKDIASSLQTSHTIKQGQDINNDEIPSENITPVSNDSQNAPSQALIEVKTDVLQVLINPIGGDIVAVYLLEHSAHIETPGIPFTLLENTSQHTYIAQSGLIGKNGTDLSIEQRPHFSAEKSQFSLQENENTLTVNLHFQQNDISITKQFVFQRNDYAVDVNYLINNQSQEAWQAALYGQIRHDGQQVTSSNMMGMQPYLGFATTTTDDRFKKIDFKDVAEKKFSSQIEGGWIAMIQHYFVSAWIPAQNSENSFSTLKTQNGLYLARFTSPAVTVNAGEQGEISAQFYAGPKDQYRLAKISPHLDLSVDYGWLWMVAQPLYAVLYFINNGTLHLFGYQWDVFAGIGNWGFAIIFLTILVKLCFFSLNAKAYRSMGKMRAVQPKMLEIRSLYADDKQKQSQEMMALYSKEKINPIGGCLPILVQMPVFIALYWVILESVELRHAPFIGYIKDLAAMDPYFILPIFMGASMWFQQKLNPTPPDPMQAKIMQFLPIVFTFFFLFFPAGLVLYWVVNNILSIAQQWVITKAIEKESA